MNRLMDGQTDGWIDRRMDGKTDRNSQAEINTDIHVFINFTDFALCTVFAIFALFANCADFVQFDPIC